jgi:hypothetical protein
MGARTVSLIVVADDSLPALNKLWLGAIVRRPQSGPTRAGRELRRGVSRN